MALGIILSLSRSGRFSLSVSVPFLPLLFPCYRKNLRYLIDTDILTGYAQSRWLGSPVPTRNPR